VHSISVFPTFEYVGFLPETNFSMIPPIASECDLTGGPQTTVVATRNDTGNVLALYDYSVANMHRALVTRSLSPLARLGSPPTCALAGCGPTRTCGDSGQACCEYFKAMYCCELCPY
jgi:hypothetical protein